VTRDPASGKRSLSVRGAVLVFALTALAAVLAIAVAVVWVARREASDEAVRAARDPTVTEAESAISPALTDGLVAHDPAAVQALDQIVRQRVLSDRVVRVKVWAPDGTILYSDEPSLVGRHFGLAPSELQVLDTRSSAAQVSDLNEPENEFERSFG
jgi:two-component system, NarL family, sensor kinase